MELASRECSKSTQAVSDRRRCRGLRVYLTFCVCDKRWKGNVSASCISSVAAPPASSHSSSEYGHSLLLNGRRSMERVPQQQRWRWWSPQFFRTTEIADQQGHHVCSPTGSMGMTFRGYVAVVLMLARSSRGWESISPLWNLDCVF